MATNHTSTTSPSVSRIGGSCGRWRSCHHMTLICIPWSVRRLLPPMARNMGSVRLHKVIQMYIPSHDLGICDPDQDSGERLTVPCLPVFQIADTIIGRPTDMFRCVSPSHSQYRLADLTLV